MAFYAEMVRRKSWLVSSVNMIYYYKKVLAEIAHEEYLRKKEEYDKWYNSLSNEERLEVDRREKEKREARDRELYQALYNFMSIPLILTSAMTHSNRDIYDYMRDKRNKEIIDVDSIEV